jgi:hypothetical protein
MRSIAKYRTPIVWLLIVAMILSVGAGFFSVIL